MKDSYNPYEILGIKQNATSEQIEEARKKQLKDQCGEDINKKNENGEYVSGLINRAASDLLDSVKRKEIDEKIGIVHSLPILYDSSNQLPSQVVLTQINHELITQMPQIQFSRRAFDKKTKCKKLYLVVLDNGSFLYTVEKIASSDKYWLHEYFTDRTVSDQGFEECKCPWDYLEVFECDGMLSIAYPAYQILPITLIKNRRVSDSTLRAIHPVIQEIVSNIRKETSKLFEEYKVKSKGKI